MEISTAPVPRKEGLHFYFLLPYRFLLVAATKISNVCLSRCLRLTESIVFWYSLN